MNHMYHYFNIWNSPNNYESLFKKCNYHKSFCLHSYSSVHVSTFQHFWLEQVSKIISSCTFNISNIFLFESSVFLRIVHAQRFNVSTFKVPRIIMNRSWKNLSVKNPNPTANLSGMLGLLSHAISTCNYRESWRTLADYGVIEAKLLSGDHDNSVGGYPSILPVGNGLRPEGRVIRGRIDETTYPIHEAMRK